MSLRTTDWDPSFDWVPTLEACAVRINEFHPDLPKVEETREVLESIVRWGLRSTGIPTLRLLGIHQAVFEGYEWAGRFRSVNVRVGPHAPPPHAEVPDLMKELEAKWAKNSVHQYSREDLEGWYFDFETIHPFQDGNGRVGAIVVAAHARLNWPELGWLAPNQ